MTEEIIMFNKSDVESLEEAIKRLEQENRELKDKTYFRLKEEYLSELQRLEQENKDFEILAKSLYKRIEELEKENEALAFRERLYKADYEASEQENKELREKFNFMETANDIKKLDIDSLRDTNNELCSALEEIREIAENAKEGRYTTKSEDYTEGMHTIGCYVLDKINEVLNE